MITSEAKVTVKDSTGKEVASQVYSKVNFHGMTVDEKGLISGGTPEELLGAAIQYYQTQNPKGNGVIDLLKDATYAYDLGARATIRQTLVTAVAGPEKAIDKSIKDLMAARAAAGKPITEDVARAKIMALMAE